MPADVLLGIVLTCVGTGFTGIIFGWGLLGLRGLTSMEGITVFFQTQDALVAAQSLVLNVGLFLLLRGILRILPRAGFWSWVGPILILVGGIAIAVAYVAQFLEAPYMFPPTPASSGVDVGLLQTAGNVALFAGGIAATLGMLLSLIAVARGVLGRRAYREPPAPT